jgi:parallel beta-helix repeat protein
VVENNVVAGNARGFFIYDAEYNTLRGNLVVDNQVGVHLWAGSTRNVVERNDFISNREQVKYVASATSPGASRKATTGATTWAGTATATAWATCPTRPTTWSTASRGATRWSSC